MIGDEDTASLREELREIDERIEELRRELADVKEDLRDWEDSGSATRMLEENEALIATLEARRDEIRRELGEP